MSNDLNELKAMRSIIEKLGTLEPSVRLRVLNWVVAKAHEEIEAERQALGFAKRQTFGDDSVGSVAISEQ